MVGLSTTSSTHDVPAVTTHLDNMLATATGYSGSSASSTVLTGRSLIEAYYHPDYRAATRAAVAGECDYLVIFPETTWLNNYPEMTFDGVLQMSRQSLHAGTKPLLLMPGRTSDAYTDVLGVHSYRIANGCGIHAVPGGYALKSAKLLSPSTTNNWDRQAYLLAATVFTRITGLNAITDTTYRPSTANTSTLTSLAKTAEDTVNAQSTAVRYSTSRETAGLVRYRTFTPPNNLVRYVWTGTSTEQGISASLTPIFQASGYTVSNYRVSSQTRGWSTTLAATAEPKLGENPGEYVLGYVRSVDVTANSSTMTDPHQPNLVPIAYDQHYTGMSTTQVLSTLHEISEAARSRCTSYGWATVPVHLGAARLHDADRAIRLNVDSLHWDTPMNDLIGAMMVTSSLGREPSPPAITLANPQRVTGFNVGKEMLKQLAFLAETGAYVPDTALSISTPPPLTAVKGQAFGYTFAAAGGTAPYTWSEESADGLPAGLTLSSGGSLSGITSADPGDWQLVIQVKDSSGAIRKIPVTLSVALTGSGDGTLAMAPAEGLSAFGNAGGPFAPSSQVYTLSNVGTTSINWTAAKVQPWVSLSATSGTLAAGANTTVTVSINSNANALAGNSYSDAVIFTNTTNNNGNSTRSVTLAINAASATSTWDANGSAAGQTDGAGEWLAAGQWWNGTANANWTSSNHATFGNGGVGGAVTLASPTTVNALNFNAFTGTYTLGTIDQTLTLNGGITMNSSAGAVSLASPVSLGFPQTWANHSSNTLTATSPIGGSGNLTKSGTGTLVLSPDADNSAYTGTTTVASGVLNIRKSTALGSVAGGTSVSSGATLQIQGGITVGAEALALDGSGVFDTGALRNISGTNFYGGLLTLNGSARIQVDAGTLVLSNPGTITGEGAALTIAGAGHTNIMGSIATGSGSLTKEGSGTLTLSGANTHSGGTIINGGNISLASDSLGAANSSVTVNTSTNLTITGNVTLEKSFQINNNATLTFINATSHVTVTGAVSGNGGIRPVGGGTLGQRITTLSSTSNSFTGPISNPVGANNAELVVNSLHDGAGAGDITFGESGQTRVMRLQLGAGATSPLSLSHRRIAVIGTTPTAMLSNNNATAANTFTIHSHLLNSHTGAATLDLGGSNSGNNRFAGNLTDGSGGGTLGLTKSGAGVWALSGTNTYSRVTINGFSNPAGTLIFQGLQALPSATTLQQTHNGGTGGFAAIRLLDDSATPASRTGVNLAMLASVSNHTMSLFVGNNSTANGGTSSSTQTGSTIALGNLNFTQNSSTNTSQRLSVSGANGYRLTIQNVDLPALVATTNPWTGILNPTSAPLTVAGTVRQKAGSLAGAITFTLRLDGTASGNQILGEIMDSADETPRALALSKLETGVWTLSGNNSYTGTTTVSAGKLFINGDQTAATGNFSVAANATLGGTGTIGGNTTIAANGRLEFNLSSTPAGHDKLELASGRSLTFSGASQLTITSLGDASTGTYTLITAPGGIVGTAPTPVLPAGWVATTSIFGNDLLLNVTSVGIVTPGHLQVTSADGFTSSGYVGGPFSPASVVYTLSNTGQTSIDWTAGKSAAWLGLSATSGILAPGASTTVTVSIQSPAESLSVGTYNDTVTFTNTSNGNGNTTRAVSLTAVALPTYAVSYHGNGNTGGAAPSNQTKTYNIDLTLSGQGTLVRAGYGFIGWNTEADGSGTSYAAGASYKANAAMTLYAQWELLVLAVVTDKATVTVPEGATASFQVRLSNPPENTVTVTVTRSSGDADITVQSGGLLTFTTGNWSSYQTVTLAAAVDDDTEDGTATITCASSDPAFLGTQVIAVEADKHTTLTLANDGNGSTAPTGTLVVEKGLATAISATPNEDYDLVNWSVLNGSATFADADSASTTVTLSAPATVQANFALKTYSVSYSGNGHSDGTPPAEQTKTHGEDLTLATNSGNLAKTGHTFSGWNTAADGSGTDYAAGENYTENAALTLHAKWTANNYSVTFDPNGGTPADPATMQVTFGSPYGTLATTSRAGYTFAGWFTATSGGTQVTAVTTVSNAANHSLFARWTANAYTVTFAANGGTAPSPASKSVTFASTYGDLATSSRAGYTFTGWYTAAAGGTRVDSSTLVTTSTDHTLYAQWTNALTWDSNGTGTGQTNGAGAWLGSNLWWDGANNQTWVSGSFAIFGTADTAGGAVTLASPTTVGSITFNQFTGTYTLGTSGQALTINDGIDKTSASAAVSIISPVTLGAAQTWTNNSASGLSTSNGSNMIDTGGHPLTVDGTGNLTFGTLNNAGTTLTGSGALVKNGTGILSVGGNNSAIFSGNITINDGILFFGDSVGALGTGNITITNGVLESRWNGSISRTQGTEANQIQITGGVSGFSAGGNTASFSTGAVTWGSTTFNPTEFVLQSSNAGNAGVGTFSSAINLNGANRTIRSDQATTGSGIFSGAITNSSGTAGLIKTGVGHHILTGSNTYNGGTSINQGTLTFQSIASMPSSGNVQVNDGAAIGIRIGGTGTWTNGTSGVGTLGGLLAGSGGAGSSTVSYSGNVGLLLDVNANTTYGGDIVVPTGATSLTTLTKTGSSALTLNGNNSFTGGTELRAGTLVIGSATALGSGTLTFIGGATFDNTSGSAITLANAPSTWSANFTFTGSHPLNLGTGAVTATPSGQHAITVNGSTLTVGGRITSAATNGFVKNGGGTLSLQDQANAIGTWIGINGGVLEVHKLANGGSDSSIGTSAASANNLIINNATLRYIGSGDSTNRQFRTTVSDAAGVAMTLDASGSGAINWTNTSGPTHATGNQARTLNLIGSNSGTNTFAANLADNGSGALTLNKDGTGTWVLTGASTYTGTTSVTNGKLFINGSLSDAAVALNVENAATLGGTGTIGRNVTIDTGGKLEFNLSTPAASHDRLDISTGRSFAFSGASTLTITSSGGAAIGSYTLVTGGNNITGLAPATINLPAGWAATTEISGNSLLLHVTSMSEPVPGSLAVAGSDGLTSSGTAGGSFTPGSIQYTLSNPGDDPVNWTAGKTAAWVDLSATSGTLAAGASTSVTVSINDHAISLAAGSYNDTVTFSNTTNGTGNTTRGVSLTVNAPVTYTVSYDGNGNTGGTAPSDHVKTHNIALTLAGAETLVRTGYSFAGWNTADDGSGTAFAAAATYTVNASVTLFAQWTANAYTVTFNANGGDTPSSTSTAVVFDADYGTLAAVSRTGYTFNGWFTAAADGTEVTASTTVATPSDHTLFAQWTANTYTVTYDVNGGDELSPETMEVTFGQTYGDLATVTRMGYTFAGWFTAASGGTEVASSTIVATADSHTLYAQWTVNSYTVTFDPNGGDELSSETMEATFDETYGDLATVTRMGYTFTGWFTAASGGTEVTSSMTVTTSENHTLFAQWNALPVVDAGLDQSVVLGDSSPPSVVVNLDGSVSDAENDTLTVLWTLVDGPEAVVFADASDVLSTATFTAEGTYTLRLTADDGFGSSFDECVVTVSLTSDAPVASFAITGVPSQVTLGTSVTGITLTALDADGQTATGFTGTVTFGGTAGITGTSAEFVAGILSEVSISPMVLGNELTFTVDDDAGHVGSAVFSVVSAPYSSWAAEHGLTGDGADLLASPSGDGVTNLQKFAFGMDPGISGGAAVEFVENGEVIGGMPTVWLRESNENSVDYRAVFTRRKDHQQAGLRYEIQFSADLGLWVTQNITPTVISGPDADDDIEAVSVPYPSAIETLEGFRKPNFFRIGVSME
ncbi:MAG: InlB B-repeat-containing protein [Luteolibacter sp.]